MNLKSPTSTVRRSIFMESSDRIEQLLGDESNRDLFSESYFARIETQLDKVTGKLTSIYLSTIVIGLVMFLVFINEEISFSIGGLSFSKSDKVIRDVIFFFFLNACLLISYLYRYRMTLISILDSRYKSRLNQDSFHLFRAAYIYMPFAIVFMKKTDDQFTPTIFTILMQVFSGVTLMCVIAILGMAAISIQLGLISYAIYTIFNDPSKFTWLSYLVGVYAILVFVHDIAFGILGLPLVYDRIAENAANLSVELKQKGDA
ncbi:hypothetical protein [Methylocystis echinoides]|uniref:hypothetical protein n=1 Tax=Methylocystis echinoides TaxID=29468 RepID=UPI00343D171C